MKDSDYQDLERGLKALHAEALRIADDNTIDVTVTATLKKAQANNRPVSFVIEIDGLGVGRSDKSTATSLTDAIAAAKQDWQRRLKARRQED